LQLEKVGLTKNDINSINEFKFVKERHLAKLKTMLCDSASRFKFAVHDRLLDDSEDKI